MLLASVVLARAAPALFSVDSMLNWLPSAAAGSFFSSAGL